MSILAAIAVPAYGDYLVKARVSELLVVADVYKLKLIDNNGPGNNVYNLNTDLVDYVKMTSIDGPPTKYIIEVVAKMKSAKSAGIGISKPANANDSLAIQLQGVESGEVIAWSCHAAEAYHKYVPKNCQNLV